MPGLVTAARCPRGPTPGTATTPRSSVRVGHRASSTPATPRVPLATAATCMVCGESIKTVRCSPSNRARIHRSPRSCAPPFPRSTASCSPPIMRRHGRPIELGNARCDGPGPLPTRDATTGFLRVGNGVGAPGEHANAAMLSGRLAAAMLNRCRGVRCSARISMRGGHAGSTRTRPRWVHPTPDDSPDWAGHSAHASTLPSATASPRHAPKPPAAAVPSPEIPPAPSTSAMHVAGS